MDTITEPEITRLMAITGWSRQNAINAIYQWRNQIWAGGMYQVPDYGVRGDGAVDVKHITVNGKGRIGRLHE